MPKKLPKPEGRISLRRMVGWSAIGQIIYTVSQFFMLVVLTRFASVEDVGRFGLAGAIVVPLCFFFGLNMRANQATDTKRDFRFSEFMRVQFISIISCFLTIIAISQIITDPTTASILVIFGAAKCIETFSELFYGRYQQSDRMRLVATSLIARGGGSTLIFSLVLIASENVALSFLAHLVVWGAVAIFIDYPRARSLALEAGDSAGCRPGKPFALAREALPLGINGLLSGLQGQVPRYVIGNFMGVAALGQFTVAAYGIQAVTMFVMALGNALIARLALFVHEGDARAVRRVVGTALLLSAMGGAAMIILTLNLGDWLMFVVFGPSYQDLGFLLTICMVIATGRASVLILQVALFSFRKFKQAAYVRAVVLAVLVAASIIGVLQGGLIGVAIAVALVTLLHFLSLLILLGNAIYTMRKGPAKKETA